MDIIQTICLVTSFVLFNVDGERYQIPKTNPEDMLQLSNGKSGAQLGFLVRIGEGCTGTLIHKDWVLTAAHCLKRIEEEIIIDKNGDKIMNLSNSDDGLIIHKPVGGTRVQEDKLWNKPIKLKWNEDKSIGEVGWRTVETTVMHPGFKGEALSWEGGDIALLKLSSETMSQVEGNIIPICLPEKNDGPGEVGDKLFIAGYGRRTLPHCVTNNAGPVKFGICGRPTECTKVHRARRCGLQFLYDGKVHKHCIQTETPSSNDPICKELLKSLSKTKILSATHILSEKGNQILKTCYPTKPPKNSKGWCTVRDPMHDENTEPEYDRGWGFCSKDHDQETCNDNVVDEIDLEAFPVSQLSKSYCLEQLMLNLNVEQPDVKYKDVEPFPRQFCTGRNISLEFNEEHFVQKKTDGTFKKLNYDQKLKNLLLKKYPEYTQVIDGGPACFGDSGGPVFKLLGSVPVIQGVFSYMLWGTCRGRHEPSYYGRVSDYLDWIFRHVPKKEVCRVNVDG